MNIRLFLLGTVAAVLATGTPITLTFTGTGSGSIGSTPFTDESFTFTFDSNTTDVGGATCYPLVMGATACPNDLTTPSGTSNTFTIGDVTGYLTGDQAVFENSMEYDIGIWDYNGAAPPNNSAVDFLTLGNGTVFPYTLDSNLSDVTGTASALDETFPADVGGNPTTVTLSAVSALSFSSELGSSPPTPPTLPENAPAMVPEPSTLLLLGVGLCGLGMGKKIRKA